MGWLKLAALVKIMGRIDSLITSLKSTLQPWRTFLIAIDGRDGVGKSPLGRRLSLELKLPLIETDLYINDIANSLEYHTDELKRVINTRLKNNRPVIVEGIFIRQLLKQLELEPNYVIYVTNSSQSGSYTWQRLFEKYESVFAPTTCDYKIEWGN